MQPIKTLLTILIVSSLTACATQTTVPASQTATVKPVSQAQSSDQTLQVEFVNKNDATKLLATADDYTQALSSFDWQAKFKSERPLTQQELQDYYAKAAVNWDAASKQKVMIAVDLLQRKIAPLHLNKPPTLKILLTNGLVEAGAAYTREDYIVLTTNFLQESQADINHLVAHEFSHVYSRYNRNQRDKLYATVNFKKIPPLDLPSEIDALRITNPDSPQIHYGIDLDYQGKVYTFVPLSVSDGPYDVASNLPFFAYLNDGLLAVETVNGKSKPIYINNQPLFVAQEDTNYLARVQPNADYMNDPEEVLAENFSYWVAGKHITHRAPVDKLLATMKAIR